MTAIQKHITENFDALPKSTFNGDELVIVHEVSYSDWGYGNHHYEGVGVDRGGKIYWCYSSGCSCNGDCGMDHKDTTKVLEAGDGFDLANLNPEDHDFPAAVEFSDY